MTCDSLQERAGRGLSDDTNHVAVRAHGEATEANKDRRHQNLSAPDILIFNTNFPPPKMYECARLQNVRVGEICVKTTSGGPLRRRAAGRAVAAPRLVLRRRRRVRHSEGCFGGATWPRDRSCDQICQNLLRKIWFWCFLTRVNEKTIL